MNSLITREGRDALLLATLDSGRPIFAATPQARDVAVLQFPFSTERRAAARDADGNFLGTPGAVGQSVEAIGQTFVSADGSKGKGVVVAAYHALLNEVVSDVEATTYGVLIDMRGREAGAIEADEAEAAWIWGEVDARGLSRRVAVAPEVELTLIRGRKVRTMEHDGAFEIAQLCDAKQDSESEDLKAMFDEDELEEIVIDIHSDPERELVAQTASILTLDEETGRRLRSVRATRIVADASPALS